MSISAHARARRAQRHAVPHPQAGAAQTRATCVPDGRARASPSVVGHVRGAWGNRAAPMSEQEVRRLRKAIRR
ncbi:hypothetical protein DPV79_16685 [Burkholderia reimsis]|uniref:Uncharacterized protein n=1 Tax=Burkholderia reimsis TaxID=2234132 RepID=A0A365QU49_9BURK|nr:hypothetical protein DPV79_16685 [Burkholderia reimsis]